MKWLSMVLGVGLALLGTTAVRAVPPTINYQGVVRDPATGKPKPPGVYPVVFRLWDSETAQDPVNLRWEESRTVTCDVRGYFTVDLGTVTPIPPSALSSGDAWMEIAVEGETLSPRRRLTSVPYALSAADAQTLGGHPPDDYVLKNSLRPVVSVSEFGALGNGTHDDAQAIRNGLASLAAQGGTLRFPPGRYLIGSTVEVTQDHVSLVGDNRNACVWVPASNSVTTLRIRADGVRVSGLGFEGVSGSTSSSAIEVIEGQDGFIWDCSSVRFAHGVSLHGDPAALPPLTVSEWNVARCNWSQTEGSAIYLHHCDKIRLSETWIDTTATPNLYGILIESGASDVYIGRINITGGTPVLVRDFVSPLAAPQNIYFNQVLADSSYVFGMQFESGQQITLVDCWAAGCKTGPGIVIANAVSGMSLIACRIFGNWNEGLRVVSGNPEAHLLVEGCYIGANSQASANVWDGIVIEPSVGYFLITGNGCWNRAAAQGDTQRYGISIGSGCDNFVVSDNICKPNRTGGILNASGTAATRIVTGNLE